MGYYTHYSLEVHGIKNAEEHASLRDFIGSSSYNYCFQEDEMDVYESEAYFASEDECKWYGHEKDMINLSKQFPDMIFCLEGDGEERGDMWRKYFHNGIMEFCPAYISYPSPKTIMWN